MERNEIRKKACSHGKARKEGKEGGQREGTDDTRKPQFQGVGGGGVGGGGTGTLRDGRVPGRGKRSDIFNTNSRGGWEMAGRVTW